jgi:hypothetical protein
MLFANVHIPSVDAAGTLASDVRILLLGRDAALVGNARPGGIVLGPVSMA